MDFETFHPSLCLSSLLISATKNPYCLFPPPQFITTGMILVVTSSTYFCIDLARELKVHDSGERLVIFELNCQSKNENEKPLKPKQFNFFIIRLESLSPLSILQADNELLFIHSTIMS